MTDLLIDLACAGVGGRVLEVSDEWFAPKERLIRDDAPVSEPGRTTDRGRWTDGWVTRRRREPGHEWAIVRFGYPGVLRRLEIDTRHITGDAPEAVSVEAAAFDGDPHIVDLVRSRQRWSEMVSRVEIDPDFVNGFGVGHPLPLSHVRLVIYPDGGIARLRCLGEPVPPEGLLDGETPVDLAAVAHGGRVVATSAKGTNPNVMLRRSGVRGVEDIWETPRHRGPGAEWAIIRLGGRGTVSELTVDTSTVTGSLPASCTIEAIDAPGADGDDLHQETWTPLVDEAPLDPNRRHTFGELPNIGEATHLRLHLHPDGAIGRFAAIGVATTPWQDL